MSSNTTKEAAHCRNCGQDVKPVERKGLSNLFAWLALLEFAAIVASVWAAFRPYGVDGGLVEHLVLWPAALHPAWLGILAAVGAFIAAAAISAKASEHAEKTATCPKCEFQLTATNTQP